jgi:hypothetical protein
MTNDGIDTAPARPESGPPAYTSLILRCWRGEKGKLRIRLVNVQSGASHLVSDLDELPDLISHLVLPAGVSHEESEANP